MKPLVYLDTSIFSFYFDERPSPYIVARRGWTRAMFEERRDEFSLVISEAVLTELAQGNLPHRFAARDLAETLPIFRVTDQEKMLARAYVENFAMPRDPLGDALHLAVATCRGCDSLVTWNCTHLANPNKKGHIERLNRSLGWTVPLLLTPLELLGIGPE